MMLCCMPAVLFTNPITQNQTAWVAVIFPMSRNMAQTTVDPMKDQPI